MQPCYRASARFQDGVMITGYQEEKRVRGCTSPLDKQRKMSSTIMLRRFTHVSHRQFHRSVIRFRPSSEGNDDDYEIDLITLKKREKKKPKRKKSIREVMEVAAPGVKYGEGAVNEKVEVTLPFKEPVEEDTDDARIVNLSEPVPKKEPTDEVLREAAWKFLDQISKKEQPPATGKQPDGLWKLVSHEVPHLTKEAETLAQEIEQSITKMKEIKSRIQEVEKREQEALDELLKKAEENKLERAELEKFLKDAKQTKDKVDEEHFREQRRYEFSLNSARTLQLGNFFTPIDEKLIRSAQKSRSLIPRFSLKEESDDLLFPTIPKTTTKNLTHEFMVYFNGKQIMTHDENPLGPHHHVPDLVTIFKELGDPSKYMKTITKLEDQKWRLIGVQELQGEKVLVFERFIDKEQEAKDQKRAKIRRWATIGLVSFAVLNTVGFYLDDHSLV